MDVNELSIKASLTDDDRILLEKVKEAISALLPHIQSAGNLKATGTTEEEDPMSKEETARFLRCSLPSLTKRVAEGKIPVHRMGRRVWFFKSEILKSMASPLNQR